MVGRDVRRSTRSVDRVRMAASVGGSAAAPFATTTRWKPPASHMVRMMALSSTSTTLQQKRAVGGQCLGPCPARVPLTPGGARTVLGARVPGHWRRRAFPGRGLGGDRPGQGPASPTPSPTASLGHLRLRPVGRGGPRPQGMSEEGEETHPRQRITEPGALETVQGTRKRKAVVSCRNASAQNGWKMRGNLPEHARKSQDRTMRHEGNSFSDGRKAQVPARTRR